LGNLGFNRKKNFTLPLEDTDIGGLHTGKVAPPKGVSVFVVISRRGVVGGVGVHQTGSTSKHIRRVPGTIRNYGDMMGVFQLNKLEE